MLPNPPKQLGDMSKEELAALSLNELRDLMREAADSVLGPTERERIEMCGNNPADLRG